MSSSDDVLQLITDFRGGIPEICDFCGQPNSNMVPEEAGLWACIDCWKAAEVYEGREEQNNQQDK